MLLFFRLPASFMPVIPVYARTGGPVAVSGKSHVTAAADRVVKDCEEGEMRMMPSHATHPLAFNAYTVVCGVCKLPWRFVLSLIHTTGGRGRGLHASLFRRQSLTIRTNILLIYPVSWAGKYDGSAVRVF